MTEVVFARKKFSAEDMKVRQEGSKYPYDELEVGEGFLFRGKNSSISGNVSKRSKQDDKLFVCRQTTNPEDGESVPGAKDGASKENPFTWVIRAQ